MYRFNETVNKGCRGVVQEFGVLKREVSEGLHYINPVTEIMSTVNMKVQVIDLDKQNVMTSDKLSITIDSVVFYKITNVDDACFKIQNVVHSVTELSYATLRNVIGNTTLETCLGKRDELAQLIKQIIDENIKNWGIKIISIQIKDIIVPRDITLSLSSAITAEREAKAKIITAKADVEAAQLMRDAADILSTDAAMQIRALEVIDKLAHSANTKIVFLPSDLSLQSKNIKSQVASKQISF